MTILFAAPVLFNSLQFALFLPTVFLLYWWTGNHQRRIQNFLLLSASYIFYGFWDWRFLFLILLSSLIDFFAGWRIHKSQDPVRRKWYLYFSIFWNIGILFLFKYFNFFLKSLATFLGLVQQDAAYSALNIILPVGLSFYTFQTISYTIDVYKKNITPTPHLLEFLGFVSFFPQLVAGPIERAAHLLPQFLQRRFFDSRLAKDGLRQILWGLFKKMVIADNLAIAVNAIFADPGSYESLELFYGLVLFYFQIYCDFSGYVDIAIGSARLFGFRLSRNFRLPHFALNIPDFWRRWNITLSAWFRDYVHLPFLRGTSRSPLMKSLALILTFGLIGLWHGANWTFILFGLIHAFYMIGYRLKTDLLKRAKKIPSFVKHPPEIFSIGLTFLLITLSIVFFRAPSVSLAIEILKGIFSFIPDDDFKTIIGLKVLFLPALVVIEYFRSGQEHPLQNLERLLPRLGRWIIYYSLIYYLIRYGQPKETFIYFQF